jgi:hypothetical protein
MVAGGVERDACASRDQSRVRCLDVRLTWTLGYSTSGPALWNAVIVAELMAIFSHPMTDRRVPTGRTV